MRQQKLTDIYLQVVGREEEEPQYELREAFQSHEILLQKWRAGGSRQENHLPGEQLLPLHCETLNCFIFQFGPMSDFWSSRSSVKEWSTKRKKYFFSEESILWNLKLYVQYFIFLKIIFRSFGIEFIQSFNK